MEFDNSKKSFEVMKEELIIMWNIIFFGLSYLAKMLISDKLFMTTKAVNFN